MSFAVPSSAFTVSYSHHQRAGPSFALPCAFSLTLMLLAKSAGSVSPAQAEAPTADRYGQQADNNSFRRHRAYSPLMLAAIRLSSGRPALLLEAIPATAAAMSLSEGPLTGAGVAAGAVIELDELPPMATTRTTAAVASSASTAAATSRPCAFI